MKKINRNGYTLMETLAAIVIISLILSIVFISVISVIYNSKKNINEKSKELVMKSVEYYTNEYRNINNKNWLEGYNDVGNISFCVSIRSLVNSGYYKGDEDIIDTWNDKYLVYVELKENGVYDYDLIDINESNKCEVSINNIDLDNQFGNYKFTYKNDKMGEEIELASLNYTVTKKENDKLEYIVENLFTINELPKMEVNKTITVTKQQKVKKEDKSYITLVLDKSGSMKDYRTTVDNAVKNLANGLIDDLEKTRIAVIEFDAGLKTKRKFSRDKLEKLSATGSGTSIASALALAARYNYGKTDGKKIIILFYDGEPTDTLYYRINNKDVFPSKSNKLNTTFIDNYVINSKKGTKKKTCKDYSGASVNFHTSRCFYDFKVLAEYLIKQENTTLIQVGFNISDRVLKNYMALSSVDNKLCKDSDYKVGKNNYCFYKSNNKKVNTIFNNLKNYLTNELIEENIEYVDVTEEKTFDAISKIKIELLSDNVTFRKNGVDVDKIIYEIDFSNPDSYINNDAFDVVINTDNCIKDSCEEKIKMFKANITYYDGEGVEFYKDNIEGTELNLAYKKFLAIN